MQRHCGLTKAWQKDGGKGFKHLAHPAVLGWPLLDIVRVHHPIEQVNVATSILFPFPPSKRFPDGMLNSVTRVVQVVKLSFGLRRLEDEPNAQLLLTKIYARDK